jgi:hypothetical protein
MQEMTPLVREVARLARPLRSASKVLEVVAIIGGALGVVLGIAFATVSSQNVITQETTHPYVAVGLAIAIESIVSALFFWAVARGLQLIAVDTAARHGVGFHIELSASPAGGALAGDASMAGAGPGWYPDPDQDPTGLRQRYWNGIKWTGQTRESPDPS